MVTKRVEINGKVYRLESLATLRERVETFQESRGASTKEFLSQTTIRDHAGDIYHQLGVLGYVTLRELHPEQPHRWKRNPGVGLTRLGFSTQRRFTFDDIEPIARRIIPPDLAEKILTSYTPRKFSLRKRFEKDPEGAQVLPSLLKARRSDVRRHGFAGLLSALYPDLEQKYHLQFSDVFHPKPLKVDYIRERCRDWFFAGESLGIVSMPFLHPAGRRVSTWIDQHPLPGEFVPHNHTFLEKVLHYLDLPYLRKTDLSADGLDAIKVVSQIGERQTLFALALALKYDPHLRSFGAFLRPVLDAPLRDVIIAPPLDRLQLKQGDHYLEADARIISGRSGDSLLEIKTHRVLSDSRLREMCEKYRTVRRWRDGTPVDKKIAFLNSNNGDLQRYRKLLHEYSWEVLGAEGFSSFYEGGLEALLDAEPHFFDHTPVPVRTPRELFTINHLLLQTPNLLLKRGQRFLRTWVAQMFRKNLDALLTDERVEARPSPAKRTVIPFSAYEHVYGDRVRAVFPNCLFYDLETAGLRNSGAPIVALGMAYVRDGAMVIDQYFIRDPLEEVTVLRAFLGWMKDFKRVVTFNGASFDQGYLSERYVAHLIPPDIPSEHLDLYADYYRSYAAKRSFPHATLQTYERTALNIRRQGDIPGSKIPQAYLDYVMGTNGADDMQTVLEHNRRDLVTLVCMYEDYKKSKRK